MTIQNAYMQLQARLFDLYSNREAGLIADMVLERVTGFKKIDRILNKSFPLSQVQQDELEQKTAALLRHQPVQYVLGQVWWGGMQLYVNEHVLIPRPETEELVEWVVLEEKSSYRRQPVVLDVGTGSGCIPLALKHRLPGAVVSAVDVSAEALVVARQNAESEHLDICWKQLDFLDPLQRAGLGRFDIIVSNPPYIRQQEAAQMDQHVLQYEPHLALFVPDNDPLLFYKALANFAREHLVENGKMYVEINEALATEVMDCFKDAGLKRVITKKDLQGKDRMVKGEWG